jgi:hypothetical protein
MNGGTGWEVLVTERRRSVRQLFFAEARITESRTRYSVTSQTNELSSGGCHLDMRNPLATGSTVSVRLTHGGETVEIPARVVHSTPNVGMGVAFEAAAAAEPVLSRWLVSPIDPPVSG